MNNLVLGSCRIVKTLMGCDNIKIYSGGHLHTTTDILQAYDIMTGKMAIPEYLEKYVFDGWGNISNKIMSPECNILLVEISSNKNYKLNDINLHIGYEDFIERNEVTPITNVIKTFENENVIINNLNKIKNKYNCKKLIVITQNNLACLPNRYFLSYVLSKWCKENNSIFFDPTFLISIYGAENTLLPASEWTLKHNLYVIINNKYYDPQHFTEFMIEKLKIELLNLMY